MQELEASIGRPLVEKCILAAAHRKRIPIGNISADHRVAQDGVRIEEFLDFRLRVSLGGDELEEFDQIGEVIFGFIGPLHPLGAIASRIIAAFVAPIGVALVPIPVVHKPPLVVDAIKLAFAAIAEIAVEEVVVDRLGLLAQIDAEAVHDHAHDLILRRRMAHQVEPIARDAIVIISPGRIIIEIEMVARTKTPVLGKLELRPVETTPARPRAAAVPRLAIVENLLLVGNKSDVEVAIRVPRILEFVTWRVSVRDRVKIAGRDNESDSAEVMRNAPIVDHEHRRLDRPIARQNTRGAVFRGGHYVKLDNLTLGFVAGKLSRIYVVVRLGIAFESGVVHHCIRPNAVALVIIKPMKNLDRFERSGGVDLRRNSYRIG